MFSSLHKTSMVGYDVARDCAMSLEVYFEHGTGVHAGGVGWGREI